MIIVVILFQTLPFKVIKRLPTIMEPIRLQTPHAQVEGHILNMIIVTIHSEIFRFTPAGKGQQSTITVQDNSIITIGRNYNKSANISPYFYDLIKSLIIACLTIRMPHEY